jgi:polyphenol oxidase
VIEVDLGGGVLAVFTRRMPGVSSGPWRGANLGTHVGDDLAHVATNRAALELQLGVPVVYGRQVHGVRVLRVDDVGEPEVRTRSDLDLDGGVDALVTARPGLGLAVLVADCVPVLLADGEAGVVGCAHAGRVGLLDGVLEAVVAQMLAAGAVAGRIRAALGPAAGPCCYEVPEDMQRSAAAVLPAVVGHTRAGTASLDLRAGAVARLADLGVRAQAAGGCTIEDEDSYSYRRAAVTGRFAGVVAMTR